MERDVEAVAAGLREVGFQSVRDDVLTATGRKQEPFVYGSLPGEVFFFVAANGGSNAR
jgi:hypothetical protein